MPRYCVSWQDASGTWHVERFISRDMARQAAADLRYYNILAFVCCAPSRLAD